LLAPARSWRPESPVLADEHMELLALNGRGIDPQPFEMTQLARNGNWDYRHLIKATERGEFGAILIMDKLSAMETLSDIPIIFWIRCNKGAASSCLCAP
jgi:hypothetical protein